MFQARVSLEDTEGRVVPGDVQAENVRVDCRNQHWILLGQGHS